LARPGGPHGSGLFPELLTKPFSGELKFDRSARKVGTRQQPLIRRHPAGSLNALLLLRLVDLGGSSHKSIISSSYPASRAECGSASLKIH
jgi:hypothetical protein